MRKSILLPFIFLSLSCFLLAWEHHYDSTEPYSKEFWLELDEPDTELTQSILDRIWNVFNLDEILFKTRSFDAVGGYNNEVGLVEPHGRAVLYHSPDRIVVTGWYNDGTVGSFVSRHWLNGTLDTSFGTGGVTTLSSTGHIAMVHAITTDNTGRYLLAGKWTDTGDMDYTFLVSRLTTNGLLDNTFATVGFNTYTVNTAADRSQIARAIGFDSQNRIVVGGYTENFNVGNIDIGLIRLLSDGTLDNTFDGDGRVMTVIDQYGHDILYALRVLTNDQIAIAGQSRDSDSTTDTGDFLVGRYLENGSPDTTFDVDGFTTSGSASNRDRFYAMTTDPNGDIIACGRFARSATLYGSAFFRYTETGTQRNNAGYNFGNDTICRGIERNENNGLMFGGKRRAGTTVDWEFLTGRLNSDLTLDATYSGDGYDLTNMVVGDDVAHGIGYSEGKFVIAGYANMDLTAATTQNGLAILRMDSAGVEAGGGEMDISFNVIGYNQVDVAGDTEEGAGIVRDSQNRFIVGGYTENGNATTRDFVVTRFFSNGALDTSFGTGGITVTAVSTADTDQSLDMAIDSNDKVYLAGWTESGGAATRNWAIVRYGTDGLADASWGTNGIVTADRNGFTDQAHHIQVGTDNFVYVAGFTRTTNNANTEDFAVARFFSDGTMDTSWGTSGWGVADFGGFQDQPFAMVLTSLNEPILTGWAEVNSATNTERDIGVARFRTDGTLNASWGLAGLVSLNINTTNQDAGDAIMMTADGGIIVAATIQDTQDNVALIRYTSNGVLDAGFGTTAPGYTVAFTTDTVNQLVRKIAYNPQGKIVVSGNQMIARFNTDGSLDSFGGPFGYGRPTQAPGAEVLHQLYYQPDGRIITGGRINNNLGIIRVWP